MQILTTAILATSIATSTLAIGNAKVINNCADNIYLWSVSSTQGAMQTISKGASYSEPFHTDNKTGGIALRITRFTDGLFNGRPQTTLSYSLDGNNIWYDLSDAFGDAFSGSKLEVVASDAACPKITWAQGVSPGGSQTKVCQANSDVALTTCA
ncbi:hypothetical protein EJ05DRAFT_503399 [Pseudovirgaria hyperparasitica]|uniref:BYS1 domain protein n=1 Tax=Pseudovirgaria hyperparasitica TaxID=470096 RepID=A0A6A6VYY5_9PEZI|nr:uncharacterized protein EJ05DRAFT_503399 [Pseudovirgaria hyperparasitica]KAF2755089.1 hypothetical protein EJ05DRAFT_503399 [Pseudovirgaria hyperparasitica]